VSAAPAVLVAEGLRKRYGGLVVTDDVSLALAPGARHALIGPNGAGKTTLVGLLCGAIRADAGRVLVAGEDVTRLAPDARVKRGLVRTFQVTSLFPALTVRENVLLAASEHAGTSRRMFTPRDADAVLAARVDAVLADTGLAAQGDTRVSMLPYGPQRLVEIALALALAPKVLLLDEPAAGVPAADTDRILAALGRLPPDIAILMIEHDMHVVRQFAREVTVLVAGRVLTTGAPDAVMADAEVRRVYLGTGGTERFAAGGRRG
jgi:branched-chain amino acid transport system ATP-binding protein